MRKQIMWKLKTKGEKDKIIVFENFIGMYHIDKNGDYGP